MDLHIFPGLALEIDKACNQCAGKCQDEIFRLTHRRDCALINQHIANHAAAECGEQRDKEETDDVVAALPGDRAADYAHEQDTTDIGPAVHRLNERIYFCDVHDVQA